MTRAWIHGAVGAALVAVAVAYGGASNAQTTPSDKPDHPFKLATFEAGGKIRVGLVLGSRVLDLDAANQHVTERAKLTRVGMPGEMRALIEQYQTLSPRLYQIANYFKTATTDGLPFAFDGAKVSFKAPIKYPWNVLAAAANYKAHAEGMGSVGASGATPGAGAGAGAGAGVAPDAPTLPMPSACAL